MIILPGGPADSAAHVPTKTKDQHRHLASLTNIAAGKFLSEERYPLANRDPGDETGPGMNNCSEPSRKVRGVSKIASRLTRGVPTMFQPRGFLSVLSSRILREALLLLLLSLLLLFPMRGEAQATPLTQGQWARYSMSGDMAGDVVNSTFTVLSLAHNLLTIQQVDLSSDCTPLAETHSLNLTTGRGSIEPGFYFAILPGKAVGSPVYGDPTFSISQRLTGTYAQAARQVDYAHVANDTDSIGYYWDLDTGVFTEIIDTYLSSSGGRLRTNVAVDAKMIETNMWGPSTSSPLTPSCSSTLSSDSTNPSLLYTAAIASTSLIIVIALLFARNTRKKPKRK